LQIVEYGDFQCPYCGAAEPIVGKILSEFGSVVSVTFRNFPLTDIHAMAFTAACSAEAAGKQGKYWEMHDYILAHQIALSDDFLLDAANKLGLDVQRFGRDASSDEIKRKVKEDFDGGALSGVGGTPTFYVNGNKFNGGAEQLYETLKESTNVKIKVGGFQ
jgi:protein-disulfide isomerase